jgi:hypothetical protein
MNISTRSRRAGLAQVGAGLLLMAAAFGLIALVVLAPGAAVAAPMPTPAVGAAPLQLDASTSASNVAPGQEFSYALIVWSGSGAPRSVQVRTAIDTRLEVVSAVADPGACEGSGMVTCTVSAQQGAPAAITIGVRVRPGAPASSLTVQAVAQDDGSNTAASEPVVVSLAPAPPAPAADAAAPLRSSPARPKPAPETQAAPAPGDGAAPAVVDPAAAQVIVPAGDAAPAAAPFQASPTPIVSEEGEEPAPPQAPAAPQPTAVPEASAVPQPTAPQPSPVPASPAPPMFGSGTLPNTSVMAPSFGFALALLGLALVLHGSRRVRRSAVELDVAPAARQAGWLLGAAAVLQRQTVDSATAHAAQGERLVAMMEEMRDQE